jgi:hypothetical protein
MTTTLQLAQTIDDILTGKNELPPEQAPWMLHGQSEAETLQARIDHARKVLADVLTDSQS